MADKSNATARYVRATRSIDQLDAAQATATKRGLQVLPTAWKPGDQAMYVEADQVLCEQLVPGTLRGKVTLQGFRVYRGRRAWYVAGSLPTSTGGAIAFEDDLRQLNGRKKVDRRFTAFLARVMQPVEVTE